MKIFIIIAVIWSVLDLEEFNEEGMCYVEPNNAQIIAIIFLLNLDVKERDLGSLKLNIFTAFQNQLIQVQTGEGKSIIMGFASSILALIGYEVHAVCYSSYLSERDYKSFEPLFKFLDLDDHIFYGTFNQISEVILQKQFDIRQKSVELIKSSYQLPGLNRDAQRKRQANKNRKSILIIDEVDVFFSEHFYGKTFNPVAPYSCDEIREILVTVYDRGYLQH